MSAGYTVIIVQHIASGKETMIPVKVNNYVQDTLPNFSSTEVYGRMDPVFKYQNKKPTIQVTCNTVLFAQLATHIVGTQEAPAVSHDVWTEFTPYTGEFDADSYADDIAKRISALYQMMYPVYERQQYGTAPAGDLISTHKLKGPPVLLIKIPKVLDAAGTADSSFVFVPTSFSLSTGLANASKVQFAISSPNDLRYIVPPGGFGFTLGGTILHRDAPPGWEYDVSDPSSINFTKTGFPFGSNAKFNLNNILK